MSDTNGKKPGFQFDDEDKDLFEPTDNVREPQGEPRPTDADDDIFASFGERDDRGADRGDDFADFSANDQHQHFGGGDDEPPPPASDDDVPPQKKKGGLLSNEWLNAAFQGFLVPVAIGFAFKAIAGGIIATSVAAAMGPLAVFAAPLVLGLLTKCAINLCTGKPAFEGMGKKRYWAFLALGALTGGLLAIEPIQDQLTGGLAWLNEQAQNVMGGNFGAISSAFAGWEMPSFGGGNTPDAPVTEAPVTEPVVTDPIVTEPVNGGEVVVVETSPLDQLALIIEGGNHDCQRLTETLEAAQAGQAWAIKDLATFVNNGCHGLEIDNALAHELYEQAAAMGHPGARFDLAYQLMTGQGVEADQARAVEMMRQLAADGGHPYAQSYYEQWSTQVYTGNDLTGNPCGGCTIEPVSTGGTGGVVTTPPTVTEPPVRMDPPVIDNPVADTVPPTGDRALPQCFEPDQATGEWRATQCVAPRP